MQSLPNQQTLLNKNSVSYNLDNSNYNLEYISSFSSNDTPILNTQYPAESSDTSESSDLLSSDTYESSDLLYSYSISEDSIIYNYIDNSKQYNSNITKNKIFERPEYIKYNMMKHTYNNKENYQIIFNKIIFNIK